MPWRYGRQGRDKKDLKVSARMHKDKAERDCTVENNEQEIKNWKRQESEKEYYSETGQQVATDGCSLL